MVQVKFDHIHIRSVNQIEVVEYFTDIFSARILEHVQTAKVDRFVLDLGGLRLLVEKVPMAKELPKPPHLGIEHIALAVNGFDEVISKLRQKGVQFAAEPISPRPGLKFCYVKGPEDILIELLERLPVESL